MRRPEPRRTFPVASFDQMGEHVFGWQDVKEFAHVLVNRYPGRESPADITIFKSLGLGIQDIAVAVKVVELAKANGIGREVEL